MQNLDYEVNLTDAVALLETLFRGQDSVVCSEGEIRDPDSESEALNAPVDFSLPFEENTEWKGESRMITLVVTLSLLGPGTRRKNGIGSREKYELGKKAARVSLWRQCQRNRANSMTKGRKHV